MSWSSTMKCVILIMVMIFGTIVCGITSLIVIPQFSGNVSTQVFKACLVSHFAVIDVPPPPLA